MIIRTAEMEDVPAIVELGFAMHRESNYAPMSFDPGRVAMLARYLIRSPDQGFVAVAERDGKLEGVIGGFIEQGWFSSERIAFDFALYVTPAMRHSSAAVRLAQAFKAWAIEQDVRQIRVGTAAGEAGQAANAIYEHLGFKNAGRNFVYDVPALTQQPAAA